MSIDISNMYVDWQSEQNMFSCQLTNSRFHLSIDIFKHICQLTISKSNVKLSVDDFFQHVNWHEYFSCSIDKLDEFQLIVRFLNFLAIVRFLIDEWLSVLKFHSIVKNSYSSWAKRIPPMSLLRSGLWFRHLRRRCSSLALSRATVCEK